MCACTAHVCLSVCKLIRWCVNIAHNLQSFFVTFQLKSRYGFDIVTREMIICRDKDGAKYNSVLSRLNFFLFSVSAGAILLQITLQQSRSVSILWDTIRTRSGETEAHSFRVIAIDLDSKRTEFTVQPKINQRFLAFLFWKKIPLTSRLFMCICVRLRFFKLKIIKKTQAAVNRKNTPISKCFNFPNNLIVFFSIQFVIVKIRPVT